MRKITLLFLTMLSTALTFAQVGIIENFDATTSLPTGWTASYSGTASAACEGNSQRVNIYSTLPTGNLTTPNQVGLSNGTDLSLSFDYSILDYTYGTPTDATTAGWGSADIQYSMDDGMSWTTIATIDDSNHVTANTCALFSVVIPAASLPTGSDVKLQITNTWVSGDYFFYIDNFNASQVPVDPPNCDSVLSETIDVSTYGSISWSNATGIPTGYYISVGTASGVNDIADNVDNLNNTSYELGTLSGGTTYYVTITPYNDNGSATGCVEQSFSTFTPPSNDNCDAAISLTVNGDLMCGEVLSGTNVNATESLEMETSGEVTGTPYTDVWFSFEATSSFHFVSLTNIVAVTGTTTDMGMALYDATSGCGASLEAPLTDSDPNSFTVSNLTIGTTYLLRVYGWSNTQSASAQTTFDVCVGTPPAPPENDACVDATPVSMFNNGDQQDASAATNNDGFIAETGCGSANDGVWYTFVVVDAGTIDVDVTDVQGWDPEITVLSGDCAAFTCVGSSDSAASSGSENVSFAATAGTQYWVNVGYYSGTADNSEGPFKIDVSTTDTATLNSSLSNADFTNQSLFSYYPNPVNDNLSLKAQKEISNVSVYNMIGQEVYRNTPNSVNNAVDMSGLQSGAYFVKVTIDNVTETVKVIKK
ncbi:T9SS type A sorting domain-containing protein [Olleya sp. HaHaR_3_96]|uniref:T9SS type A sorting domain-containing protein n=1 Tax=Olleya sp. HaHaR_3_96 TaxID=2745560 RepID=UPI001C4F6B8B|nr:T9SS type A sorting domain-containing protein [Olleya sp. HaHaR_3_96]QXP58244.1 T9SS type A sorting domain-containing protein [Olleya sp. HaHaR_3_96]